MASTQVPVPSGSGNTSIHSHATAIIENEKGFKFSSAETPGPNDYNLFSKFYQNIIVGNLGGPISEGQDSSGKSIFGMPKKGAVFYDTQGNLKLELTKKILEEIIKP